MSKRKRARREYGCGELFQALSNLKRRIISRSRHFAERVQMRLVIHSSDVIASKSYGSDITSRRSARYGAVAREPGIIGWRSMNCSYNNGTAARQIVPRTRLRYLQRHKSEKLPHDHHALFYYARRCASCHACTTDPTSAHLYSRIINVVSFKYAAKSTLLRIKSRFSQMRRT